MSRKHNAHMTIPVALWRSARALATRQGKNMTELVCEGLSLVLAVHHDHGKEKTDGKKPNGSAAR